MKVATATPRSASQAGTGRGGALSDEIAAIADLDGRLGFLAHVAAVADALAYAHGEGIIHRDLKPRNALCGAFGETVVVD